MIMNRKRLSIVFIGVCLGTACLFGFLSTNFGKNVSGAVSQVVRSELLERDLRAFLIAMDQKIYEEASLYLHDGEENSYTNIDNLKQIDYQLFHCFEGIRVDESWMWPSEDQIGKNPREVDMGKIVGKIYYCEDVAREFEAIFRRESDDWGLDYLIIGDLDTHPNSDF